MRYGARGAGVVVIPKANNREPARNGVLRHIAFSGLALGILVSLALLIGGTFVAHRQQTQPVDQSHPRETTTSKEGDSLPRIEDLIGLSDAELAKYDIAELNLACAAGLPGAERINAGEVRRTLDRWAERVRYETDRHLYKFHRNPDEYENSEAYFRTLVMISVLQQDLGVRYNPERINDPDFRDSEDLFIHGLLRGRGGTCASMPVLYVAVGRRLGYPLKLVQAKAHLFARWDDPQTGERFNIEATGSGFADPPDDHYKEGKFYVTEMELATGRYLRSLTPRAELAGFLSSRAACLESNGRPVEADQVDRWARELHLPFWGSYPGVRVNPDGTLTLLEYGVDVQIIQETGNSVP